MDDTRVQSALLGWIIPLALAISVLLRRNKDHRQKLFVLFALNVTLFYFFSFLYAWRGEPWFERIALCLAVLLPQGGLRFFRAFSTGSRRMMGRLGRVATMLGLVLIAVALYPMVLRPAVGPAVLTYVVGFLLIAILDLNVQASKAATRVDAARIRYLVIGGLITLTFMVLDRLGHIARFDPPPIGLAMTSIYLYIISQAIVRYRVFDLYEMLGRFAVLTMMGMALAGIYYGLVFWAGKGFGINVFLASLVILLLFDPLRELVENRITEFFFRERRVLEQEVAQLRHQLAHVINIGLMSEVLLDGLENSRRVTHAGLYLIDPHGRGFDLRANLGPAPETTRVEVAVARHHLKPFAAGGALVASPLSQQRERLLQEDSREKADQIGEVLEHLEGMHADVLLQIEGADQMLGLLTVRDERLRDPFSPEEVAMLGSLASQVAITVENSRLYQQTKERDRLAALGQMAAGLAHEIRNPLGAIKAAAQYIEEVAVEDGVGADQPERAEFLTVIVEEVDRLNRVVSDFLTYARPASGAPAVLDVNDILRRTLNLVEAGTEELFDLVIDLGDDLPGVSIDGERLHQVFLNLLLNALQAMEAQEARRLDVSTRKRTVHSMRPALAGQNQPSSNIEVRFADNGPGIPPETVQNIFIPFFTTKEKGSGLGLAVCQRIVRDAGGEIEVRSRMGQGTIFTVVLPIVEETEPTEETS